MTGGGAAVAQAAEALVGTPFLLGGRDPARGLDCVGMVAVSLTAAGCPVGALPPYALRQRDIDPFLALAEQLDLQRNPAEPSEGEIVLLRPGPSQWHLAILLAGGAIVHAHAGLRRVTRTPAPLRWPVAQSWRLA